MAYRPTSLSGADLRILRGGGGGQDRNSSGGFGVLGKASPCEFRTDKQNNLGGGGEPPTPQIRPDLHGFEFL